MSYRCGDGPQLRCDARISAGQLVQLADLDIRRHHPRPFGAGAEKPSLASVDQPGGMEGVARDQQLHPLARPQIGPDDDPLGIAVGGVVFWASKIGVGTTMSSSASFGRARTW